MVDSFRFTFKHMRVFLFSIEGLSDSKIHNVNKAVLTINISQIKMFNFGRKTKTRLKTVITNFLSDRPTYMCLINELAIVTTQAHVDWGYFSQTNHQFSSYQIF